MSTYQKQFDRHWYSRLKQASILDTQWLTEFASVSTRERTRFMENEVENPVFKVKPDTSLEFTTARNFWNDFLEDMQHVERNDVVRALYQEKIKAQLYRVGMLEATENGDDVAFTEASIAIYGKPKKRYFQYVASRIQDMLADVSDTPHTKAHQRLERIFKKIDSSNNTFSHELLKAPQKDSEPLNDPSKIARVFRRVLEKYEVTGWKVEIDRSLKRRIFSVNPSLQVIYIPCAEYLASRKKPLTKLGVKALAEHEIGVHVVRNFNGSRQPLQLLGIGLQGYLRGEEGVATYRQQQVEGADEYYGFDRYLAASMVMGLDGTPRDFRGLFEVLQDYYLLTLSQTDNVIDRARDGAWDTCLRVFRGTTGQSTGHLYTRDINYMEGNIGIWKLLATKPEWDEYLTIGKYDPLNTDHIEALRELEILPI